MLHTHYASMLFCQASYAQRKDVASRESCPFVWRPLPMAVALSMWAAALESANLLATGSDADFPHGSHTHELGTSPDFLEQGSDPNRSFNICMKTKREAHAKLTTFFHVNSHHPSGQGQFQWSSASTIPHHSVTDSLHSAYVCAFVRPPSHVRRI